VNSTLALATARAIVFMFTFLIGSQVVGWIKAKGE
jgi:hypothetical protein